jgi:putative tricarboxylic transport membrane protein
VIEALYEGLMMTLSWPTFGFMLVGMGIGYAVGILPGLGGAVTMAIALPFTFGMAAQDAFAFLIGITAVNETSGDITSILFGVPGEPTTAATVVDGHPLAKQGEAGRALGAALSSSMVGAIVGAFSLALIIPIVRPVVLSFGSPEFFMMTLLGITFVATLSGASPLKGLVAAGAGFLLAMVGLDPQAGVPRATFGRLELWDGIGIVPVTIGLFAIPEIVELAVRGTSIAGNTAAKVTGVMDGVKDTFRHLGLCIRSSMIGTALGVMPGMGGAVGQWVAYAHAVQTSPNRERFGKGAIEGVIGPSAANNSKDGGELIPMVAFGIPSAVQTAILLGALIIHGIVPGPDMLTKYLPLTFSMVWVLILANLICVPLSLLFINQLVKLTYVRGSLIIPFILVLIFFGAYAEKNALFDMWVALAFGALGWIMVQTDWARPPLILGLVLGKIMERYLFLSVNRYGADWLTRPLVMAFAALAVAVLVFSIWREIKDRRSLVQVPVVAQDT